MCRIHCNAAGLLGNALDVIISSMVYANSTGCAVSVSMSFAGGHKQGMEELSSLEELRIEENPYVTQVKRAPRSLKHICSPRSPHIHKCANGSWHRPSSHQGLAVFLAQDVAMTSCTAFVPPGVSRGDFFHSYSLMARILRLRRQQNPVLFLGRTLSLHLRTGRTSYDIRKRKQRVAVHEARFVIPYERMAVIAAQIAWRHSTTEVFIAHDDITQGENSVQVICKRLFPRATFSATTKRSTVAFDDHCRLSSAMAVLTYEFSSFSWTAAQMGGVPYYVLNCTEKCEQYRCGEACGPSYQGVQRVPNLQEASEADAALELH